MSIWSGIAAAGVAIALAFVVVGQPVWEWRSDGSRGTEIWDYYALRATHTVFNKTTNVTTLQYYTYDQLANLPSQTHMAAAFGEFGRFFVIGLIAAFAGLALAVLSLLKKLRGIFAGVTHLAASASILYAAFAIVFSVPSAAMKDLKIPAAEFRAQTVGGDPLMAWTPLAGWVIVIIAGLALIWASSDLWHLVPSKKKVPAKPEVSVKRIPAPLPPPPPVEVQGTPVDEPVIEEVFVIGANGLLIKHMSRSLMSDKDRDVVGSMISAISSFVREAFTERDGEVHEVSLGDHRFIMCSDLGLVLAVLVTSGQTEDIVHRLKHLIAVLRDRYGERLAGWQGEAIEGIEDELAVLWDTYHLPPPPAE
jgi:hypothetical protein